MEIKKYVPLFALTIVLLIPACGKKNNKQCKVAQGEIAEQGEQLASLDKDSQIPVVKEEVEDFFDEENISEFAFVDDEAVEDKQNLKEIFEEESGLGSLEQEKNVASADISEEDVTWKDEDADDEIAFKSVQFDINKNSINQDQKEILVENIEKAKAVVESGKEIIIEGHCCQLGSHAYNMPLSERRANAIKREMVKNGIPEEKIKIVGRGQEMPLVWSDNPVKAEKVKELAANRRSEILVG